MKASQEEIDEKVAELNRIGREISLQDNKPSHNNIEKRYIEEIRKMLEEGYYGKPPSDWTLGTNGCQGDLLAWRAARYLKGDLRGLNSDDENAEQHSSCSAFSNFQEAKIWALKNPGRVILRSPDGVGFVVKKNEKK
ncbi:TPA: hypothetical protein ACNGY5_001075 [Klebsiella michiganensis]